MNKPLTIALIILCVVSISSIPTVYSQTQSVKVLNYTYYIDSLGYFIVVGEVQNQGPNTINSTLLTGIITDTSGAQVNSYAPVWGRYLTPQQKAPFYMEFQSRAEDGTVITDISNIEINVYMAEATASYTYPDLRITNDQSYVGTNRGSPATSTTPSDGDFGVFWVTGNLKNIGTQTATNIMIYATFYNNKNEPVAVGYSENINQLAVSQTTNFKVGAFDLNQSIVPEDKKIATYSLLIQPQGPLLEGEPPVPVSTPTSPPILNTTPTPTGDSDEPSNGPNSNLNGTALSTEIYVVTIVIAIAIVAVAMLMIKRRQKQRKIENTSQKKSPTKTSKRR